MAAASLSRLLPQPLVAFATVALAALSLLATWLISAPALRIAQDLHTLVLSMCLASTVVLSYRFPIHISRSTAICMYTVPMYLCATQLAPAMAATVAGLAMLSGELLVQKQRHTYPSDIATAGARMALVVLPASVVVHLPFAAVPSLLPLGFAALVMWFGEALTTPLVIAPMSKERPLEVLVSYVRQSTAAEWAQYALGIAGTAAAAQTPWALVLLAAPIVAVHQHFKRLKELHERTRQLLERIADMVDDHDVYTGSHSRRVAAFTARLVKELAVDRVEADLILIAARIHDIGKIDIPIAILQKPGKLTDEERAVIETHPDCGADMLQQYADFRRGAGMVRYHHEAWNGSGYPRGLRGTTIPFGARVIAVADSYDAMTSDRPYRKGLDPEVAARELRKGRGVQWDPEIVDAFLRILPEIAACAKAEYLRLVIDEGEETAV